MLNSVQKLAKAVVALTIVGLVGAFSAPAFGAPTPSPSQSQTPIPSSSPAATAIATPSASPTVAAPAPTPNAPKSCSIKSAVNQKALGTLYAYVINADTGEVYLDQRADEQTPSASVMKVLTAVGAMDNLASTYFATTRVLTVAEEPGTIVLQGGGDHTLSRMTGSSYTTYKKPARLSTLAAAALKALPNSTVINKIILDASFFEQPAWNNNWKASDRTNGYISLITALQVDSDRRNPDLTSTAYSGYRSADPVAAAGKYFKAALGMSASTAALVQAPTPTGAVEIAAVNSQPITVWFDHALKYSDNTETEFIARHATKVAGLPTNFTSVKWIVKRALAQMNINTKKLVMLDGSGLAQGNRVTARMVAEVLAQVATPGSKFAALESYLPIAGNSGTLSTRFTGVNKVAVGFVKAKSGYIPGVYSLAGIVNAKDGSRIAFAAFARSNSSYSVGYAARPALDTLATRLFTCGAGSYK